MDGLQVATPAKGLTETTFQTIGVVMSSVAREPYTYTVYNDSCTA